MMRRILLSVTLLMVLSACAAPTPIATPSPTGAAPAPTEVNLPPPPGVTVVAENLLQPRGLDSGPDGSLYIAEAGVAPPPGQNSVNTGRLTKIAPDGTRTVLLNQIATGNFASPGSIVKVREGDSTASVVVSNLVYPTGVEWGPDGYLYFTNYGITIPASGAQKGALYKIKP